MSETSIRWPTDVLPPAEVMASVAAFTRGGGRSLGGIERTTRTDRGFWNITLDQVPVHSGDQHRAWNAIRTQLGGRAGLIEVPVWSFKSAPYVDGQYTAPLLVPHDDGASFDDGSLYWQGSMDVEMAAFAPLGSTIATLRLINAATASGIRFSYHGALYETGAIVAQPSDDTYQVRLSTALRAPIPADAKLEVDEPTCLCRLKDDAGMDISEGITPLLRKAVSFVEAVDYWNDLALGVS